MVLVNRQAKKRYCHSCLGLGESDIVLVDLSMLDLFTA